MEVIRRIEQVHRNSLTMALPDTFKGPQAKGACHGRLTLTPEHHRTGSGDNT